jgi:F0F1-type ATP synthase beta subunit
MSNNKEDFDAQVSAFKEKYPDFKPAKPIEVLNLIMTRKNAKEILEGKHDDVPESYFLNAGTIDDVRAKMQ